MIKFFKKNEKQPENLKEVLSYLAKLEKDIKEVKNSLAVVEKANKKNFQKLGIVRFNPFGEIGGDQSFSVALLDASDSGFVITSHYHREMNRVYAKPVKNGQSPHPLSKEEEEAIARAIGS